MLSVVESSPEDGAGEGDGMGPATTPPMLAPALALALAPGGGATALDVVALGVIVGVGVTLAVLVALAEVLAVALDERESDLEDVALAVALDDFVDVALALAVDVERAEAEEIALELETPLARALNVALLVDDDVLVALLVPVEMDVALPVAVGVGGAVPRELTLVLDELEALAVPTDVALAQNERAEETEGAAERAELALFVALAEPLPDTVPTCVRAAVTVAVNDISSATLDVTDGDALDADEAVETEVTVGGLLTHAEPVIEVVVTALELATADGVGELLAHALAVRVGAGVPLPRAVPLDETLLVPDPLKLGEEDADALSRAVSVDRGD